MAERLAGDPEDAKALGRWNVRLEGGELLDDGELWRFMRIRHGENGNGIDGPRGAETLQNIVLAR